jgi:hypothetical protein
MEGKRLRSWQVHDCGVVSQSYKVHAEVEGAMPVRKSEGVKVAVVTGGSENVSECEGPLL